MHWFLCYAESPDSSGGGMDVIVFSAITVVVVGALAFVPMALVWSRRRRPGEAVVGFALLWGVVTAAVAVNAQLAQQKWEHERNLRIQSGYFDPADTTGKPQPQWGLWGGCAAAYFGLVGWSLSGKKREVGRPALQPRWDGAN